MRLLKRCHHRLSRGERGFSIAVLVAVSACGPAVYQGTYLDKEHPRELRACPSLDIENPSAHAFEAIMSSLADNNWVVEESSRKFLLLTARVCRHFPRTPADYLKKNVGHCLVLEFEFSEDGTITAYNPSKSRFCNDRRLDAKRWVDALERTYSELRCYSDEELSLRNAAGLIDKHSK